MSRSIVVLILAGVLVACGQPEANSSTTIQAPVRSPSTAPAPSDQPTAQPSATLAVMTAPATTTLLAPTAASPLPASATITGTVTSAGQAALPPDTTLTVQLLEVLGPEYGLSTAGQQVIKSAGPGPIPFVIEYDPTRIDPERKYVISANVHRQEQLLFVTAWYPVLTGGHPTTVEAVLQPPAILHGSVSYPAQPALPPDAVLTVQLIDLLSCGVPGCRAVSAVTITPLEPGPTPFALAYDPAMIDPCCSYAVDAWISAPGRLDWRIDQSYPVLTQGHPATVDLRVVPPLAVAVVSGTITYPAQPALPADAALTIQLVDIKANLDSLQPDALSGVRISPVGPGPLPFTLEYVPTFMDPQREYAIYARLEVGGKPLFVTTTPYPVITHGHSSTVDAVLQAPATMAAVSGTITYQAQGPLPPDATLVVQVEGYTRGDVSGVFGEQVIAPVGPGPIPFAIAVDLPTDDPRYVYSLSATIYAGPSREEKILFASPDLRVLMYVPIDVTLEKVSASSTLPSPIPPPTPPAYSPAPTQPPAATASPLAESPAPLPSRITPSTLSDLKRIREVTLPFAREAAIAPASDRLAVTTSTTVALFDLPSLQQLQSAPRSLPYAEPIRLAFHPAGTAVMLRETVYGEGVGDSVTTWPITSTGATGEAHEISLLVDDQFTPAAFSSTGAVAWQDPQTGQLILQQGAHVTRTLTNISDTPDLLHSAIEPDKGVPLTTTNVTALEFSTDGSLLGLGSGTGKVMLFQTAEGTRLESLEVPNLEPGAVIEQLAFSPDATLLGAQLTDRLIVWQIGAKIPILKLKMPRPHPESTPSHDALTFSPDNQLLITADADGVTFYQVKTGAVLRSLPLVSQGLALSPDGRFLAIVHDGKVGVWGTEP